MELNEQKKYEAKYNKGHRNSILSQTTRNNFPMTTNQALEKHKVIAKHELDGK